MNPITTTLFATRGVPLRAASLPSGSGSTTAASPDTATDAKETDPKGEMTKQEESKGMPEANQANNHSSPALDVEPKKQ